MTERKRGPGDGTGNGCCLMDKMSSSEILPQVTGRDR